MARKSARSSAGQSRQARVRPLVENAAAKDPASKAANLLQLNRAAGHLAGVRKMIEQDAYCMDVIYQVQGVRSILQTVVRDMLTQQLEAWQRAATANPGAAASIRADLVGVIAKLAK